MVIYTDGACSGNGTSQAKGGFGIVVCNDKGYVVNTYRFDAEPGTTNNREELKAIILALAYYGKEDVTPIVYSDSAYCVNTFNTWMWNWEKNGWRKSDNRTPENLDLIQAYYNAWKEGYRINLQKVTGHSSNLYNELADALATGDTKKEERVRGRISKTLEQIYGAV